MIEISLTRFLDFTVKSGSPKLTSLRQTKKQLAEGYDPMTDYYKQIRDAIDPPSTVRTDISCLFDPQIQRFFKVDL